ncbi:FecR family protein [Galbibacter orientalis]|uniref:FecR family protein n=1 Tax=Galbibacter orientalis TaxID=453852 RepID=UPI0030802740
MDERSLIKFIQNQGDLTFKEEVIDWIKSSEENRKHFNTVKAKYVSKFGNESVIDISNQHKKFKKRISIRKYTYSIAATVTVLILAGSALFFSNNSKSLFAKGEYYATGIGKQKEFILKDGSKVQLNSESKLIVTSDFNDSNRTVKLFGEAFFEVTRNKEKPFIVETEQGFLVKVLGTKFNVKAYDNDLTAQTTLVSGKVEIYKPHKSAPEITLKPKQTVVFNKSEKTINLIKNASIQQSTSWRDGILTFDNTSFGEVIKNLERWYNVTIIIKDSSIENYSFSGKFMRDNNVHEVLEIIKTSSPIQYNYDIEKQKIIFSKLPQSESSRE